MKQDKTESRTIQEQAVPMQGRAQLAEDITDLLAKASERELRILYAFAHGLIR